MTEKQESLSSGLTAEEFLRVRSELKDDSDRASRSYEHYRNSGLALMSTIIGLSTGAYFSLNGISRTIALCFFVPVMAALLQQFANFRGAKYLSEALSLELRINSTGLLMEKSEKRSELLKQLYWRQGGLQRNAAMYSAQADILARIATFSFVFCGIFATWKLFSHSLGAIFSVVLLVLIFINFRVEVGVVTPEEAEKRMKDNLAQADWAIGVRGGTRKVTDPDRTQQRPNPSE